MDLLEALFPLRSSLFLTFFFLCRCVLSDEIGIHEFGLVVGNVKRCHRRNLNLNLDMNGLPGSNQGFEFLALDLQKFWVRRFSCLIRVVLTEKRSSRIDLL